MAQYIDKSALVAEIERLRKNNELKEGKDYAQFELDISCGYDMALDDLEKFLDTLEVKEVDLEKDVDKILEENDWDYDEIDFYDFAKHFFELGLKVQKGKRYED